MTTSFLLVYGTAAPHEKTLHLMQTLQDPCLTLQVLKGEHEHTLLTASCPSIIPVKGFENQSLNCA